MTSEVAPASRTPTALIWAALLAAASLCVAVTGYSFLAGNHEVYLLDPLRRAGLATFEGDFFVTETLQYHGLFSLVAAGLFQLDVARGTFLVLFFLLLLIAVWAWWRITRSLGGGVKTFLASVVLYHILLGDRALGFYSLLQDGQFNAGNVAAVALLVGIAMWIERQPLWAGVAFGVAGAFHLNYAVVCPALWVALLLWHGLSARAGGPRIQDDSGPPHCSHGLEARATGVASALALLPSIMNVGLALPAKLGRDGSNDLPLGEFVQLYVKLRHPHHYDPSAWPWWVWLAFLLPIPLAVMAWRRHRFEPAWNEAAKVWVLLMGLQLVALLFAGVFYVSETAIQMSLWRFSPHAKLLAVTAAMAMLHRRTRLQPVASGAWREIIVPGVAVVLFVIMVILAATGRWPPLGQPVANEAVIDAARWARSGTPPDAVFLVPPGAGSAFPVNARRGHVISFKVVPQLSDELAEWDQRLRDVLAVDSLMPYAGGLTGYVTAQRRMDERYGTLSAEHLFDVARRYGARYVLTLNPLTDAPTGAEVWRGNSGAVVYDAEVKVVPATRKQSNGTTFDPAMPPAAGA